MTLTEFILVSKEHLLSWQIDIPNRDIKLIRCLCSLFDEIDLNNNGILEWEEFTNYVIEKATVLNNIKSKSDEIKQYTKSHVKPIQQSQQSAQKMPYKFNNPLTKIVYLPNIDRLAFYEEGSSEIFFMNPDSGLLNQKSLKVVPKPLIVKVNQVKKDEEGLIKIDKKEHLIQPKTSILDILYLSEQKYQVLLTATNDGYIRGWKHTTNGWVLANQPGTRSLSRSAAPRQPRSLSRSARPSADLPERVLAPRRQRRGNDREGVQERRDHVHGLGQPERGSVLRAEGRRHLDVVLQNGRGRGAREGPAASAHGRDHGHNRHAEAAVPGVRGHGRQAGSLGHHHQGAEKDLP